MLHKTGANKKDREKVSCLDSPPPHFMGGEGQQRLERSGGTQTARLSCALLAFAAAFSWPAFGALNSDNFCSERSKGCSARLPLDAL